VNVKSDPVTSTGHVNQDWTWVKPTTQNGSPDVADASYELREFPVSGGTIQFVDVGKSDLRPIVLLHGVGGSWEAWTSILPRLATKRRVIAVNLPGFGGSRPLDGGIKTESAAFAVAELCGGLQLDSPVVCGHSMGGIVALHGAATIPDCYSDVIISNGTMMSVLELYRSPLLTFLREPLTVASYLFQILAGSLPIPPFVTRRVLTLRSARHLLLNRFVVDTDRIPTQALDRLSEGIGGLGNLRAAANGLGYDFRAIYRSIRGRVQIVAGQRDGIVPISDVECFCALVPQATVTVLNNVGHWPAVEVPADYADLLVELSN
jgi:pimeloyl-ACP methyl ester carboxylesterase